MGKISVVVNVVKEEIDVLEHALTSLKGFADEIVIIDMTYPGSGVSKIAEKFKANVHKHTFVNYVEPVRNFGVSKATNEWVLILDPDEELPGSLAKKLLAIANKPGAHYFRIARKNIVFGKWLKYSRWWPDYNIRFFKKGSVSWDEEIHGVPKTTGKGADVLPEESLAIIHYHYLTIEQYIEKMNRYTSIQANLKSSEGYKFVWADLIRKPISELMSRFFAGEGYKDGLHGLAISLLQAFSELVLYLKIWQKEKFKEENISEIEIKNVINEEQKKLNYWIHDALFKKTGKLVHRLKRKLRIS